MVMPSKEVKTNGAAGIDAEGGRRPNAVPAPATAAPELLDRPRRRTFTAQTKLRVWRRPTAWPTLVGSERSCAAKACTRRP
jgi:hypothetical protein